MGMGDLDPLGDKWLEDAAVLGRNRPRLKRVCIRFARVIVFCACASGALGGFTVRRVAVFGQKCPNIPALVREIQARLFR